MSNRKFVKKIAVLSSALLLTGMALFPNGTYAQMKKLNMSYIYFGNTNLYSSYVEKTQNSLNVISPNYFNLDENGNLQIVSINESFINEMHNKNIKVIPFLSNHWDRNLGRTAFENKEALVNDLYKTIMESNLDGINIDIENLTESDRDDYTDFVKLLRKKLPNNKIISVAVAPNPYNTDKGWQGSYDYEELSKYSDHLVIMTYDESYPGGPEGPVASIDFVEKSIKNALKEVPSEKILLGIPFFGRVWSEDGKIKGQGISIKQVNELIEDYDSKVIYDDKEESPKVIIDIKPYDKEPTLYGTKLEAGTYTIWYENNQSIKNKLRLVQKYNLKGSASWSLGQEDDKIWNHYGSWLNGYYFNDVENHWAEESIFNMLNKNIMKGTSDSSFSPDKALTRAQGAVILVRALGLEKPNNMGANFKDISSDYWAKEEIDIASYHGIIEGYGDGSFMPEKPVTREEMAVMLDRVVSENYENIFNEITFDDIDNKRWSYKSVSQMVKAGIIKGFEDNTFRPMENITRGQVAALMDRIIPYLENK
ncbi:S-layer homology domain-containing protein [Maledivibacter halophilus]|uniref:Spore germination protein YaaH n=1 Tax=Maledivibacter halophilus TaxID=36842 RepID=A0A1T5KI43_9FIRM|nr:S-layer homology domain-containing protein [Maledivibacter halophilus]SKC63008.1 Spore germination protein YaaH [Maledivibacter halophilus]